MRHRRSTSYRGIARVGSHLFFRWPGYWGSKQATLRKRRAPEPSAALFAQFAVDLPSSSQAVIASSAPQIEVQLAALEDAGAGAQQVEGRAQQSEAQLAGAAAIPPSRRLAPLSAGPEGPGALVIGSSALGGSRLLRMFPEEAIFYIELPAGSAAAAGRRAVDLLCGGRAKCSIYGWREASSAPPGPRLTDAASEALAFSYIKPVTQEKRLVSPPAAL